jgi:hypothetical protein
MPETDSDNLAPGGGVVNMSILDDVQNELREPRYSDHDYRGSETASFVKHMDSAREARNRLLRREASLRYSSPMEVLRLRGRFNAPDAGCFLALGEDQVWHGSGLAEATRTARQHGQDPRECLVIFYPEP